MKCYVFPGQGGQTVGMGKELYERDADARRVFDNIDDALGEKLSALIFDGSAEELNKPENVQPAIFAVSAAMYAAWKAPGAVPDVPGGPTGPLVPDFIAGHSLGEYAALYAAGCCTDGAMAKLLRLRGRLMADAARAAGDGAMAAIIGEFDVSEVAAEAGCEVANDNGGNQWVVSGTLASVQKAMEIATAKGAKLVKQLAVSVPAHSSLMAGAAGEFRAALDGVLTKAPVLGKFISNKTADVMTDLDEIKDSLAYQLTHGVRWRESVLKMVELGVFEIVEIGPGKVLTGMCPRIAPGISCVKLEV